MTEERLYTIGQLARRVGMTTSTLRYYEEEGLLCPARRTKAGYRMYAPAAEQTLTFIQRAQRIGFSLADISTLLKGSQDGELAGDAVVSVAEQRLMTLEKQLTELNVVRHELELFLLDYRKRLSAGEQPAGAAQLFDQLVGHVCGHDRRKPAPQHSLEWLLERTGCSLAQLDPARLVDVLAGQHIHVWREGEDYCILVASHAEEVEQALQAVAQLEADCHTHPTPRLSEEEEGYLFVAHGDNAYLFAQLFLALEQEASSRVER